MNPVASFLVFTDLDGSLLDHNTYSYLDARPQLYALERLGIPLIPATSKTRVEIERNLVTIECLREATSVGTHKTK